MKLTEEYIDELIAKYLAGEASPEEAILLDDWKKESPDNEDYFVASAKVLHHTIQSVDTTALYQRVVAHAHIEKPKVIVWWANTSVLRIAASVVLFSFIGLTFYLLSKRHTTAEKIYTAGRQSRSEKLADGSTVTLNKQATLTLLKDFNGKQRLLKLEGEAYFEVVHDAHKPFTIDAGGIQITDIGTAFNVEANPGSDSVIVFVNEGLVNLTTADAVLQLAANQTALFIRSQHTLQRLLRFDPNSTAYHTKKFAFNAQKLSVVLSNINKVYDRHITLANPALANCLITVEFTNETPETIAGILSETLGISYRQTATGYELTGNSCFP